MISVGVIAEAAPSSMRFLWVVGRVRDDSDAAAAFNHASVNGAMCRAMLDCAGLSKEDA
jgi:hypothetical protein